MWQERTPETDRSRPYRSQVLREVAAKIGAGEAGPLEALWLRNMADEQEGVGRFERRRLELKISPSHQEDHPDA